MYFLFLVFLLEYSLRAKVNFKKRKKLNVPGGRRNGGLAAGVGGLAAGVGGPAAGVGGLAVGVEGLAAGVGGLAAGVGGLAAGVGGLAAGEGGLAAGVGGLAAGVGVLAHLGLCDCPAGYQHGTVFLICCVELYCHSNIITIYRCLCRRKYTLGLMSYVLKGCNLAMLMAFQQIQFALLLVSPRQDSQMQN